MSTRRIATTLATAAREIRSAVRGADPDQAPSLAQLRDTGWQLIQLTGELTDLVALVAEHTARHAGEVRHVDSGPGAPHLARASRELATLRHAFGTAHAAARDYYTATSQLAPTRLSP